VIGDEILKLIVQQTNAQVWVYEIKWKNAIAEEVFSFLH
jgi:hypothetical protein